MIDEFHLIVVEPKARQHESDKSHWRFVVRRVDIGPRALHLHHFNDEEGEQRYG